MTLPSEVLKQQLKLLDFKQPEKLKIEDEDQLIKEMVKHIGSTDPELRDKLIYTSFFYLIKDNYLTFPQMESLIETCLDQEHLFLNIGLKNDDSVFTRAFSSLVIALILGKDREARFLPEELAIHAIENSIQYLQREEDLRGYVDEKGWAHSIAHGADLLDEAIKHPLFDLDKAGQCLEAISHSLFKGEVFIDDEDQRLIYPIIALLELKMSERILEQWISGFSVKLSEQRDPNQFSFVFYRTRINVSNFLKTLYFRLLINNTGETARKTIEDIIGRLHRNEY